MNGRSDANSKRNIYSSYYCFSCIYVNQIWDIMSKCVDHTQDGTAICEQYDEYDYAEICENNDNETAISRNQIKKFQRLKSVFYFDIAHQ